MIRNIYYMMAILICQAAQSSINRLSSCDPRSQRLSPSQWKGDTYSLQQKVFPTSYNLFLQNEMGDMFGFKCIFNRTASPHLSSFWRKVGAKEGEEEKNTIYLIRRLGIGSGKELHAILDQSCSLYFLKEGPLIINSNLFLWVCTL